jgi:hypothetical protein
MDKIYLHSNHNISASVLLDGSKGFARIGLNLVARILLSASCADGQINIQATPLSLLASFTGWMKHLLSHLPQLPTEYVRTLFLSYM